MEANEDLPPEPIAESAKIIAISSRTAMKNSRTHSSSRASGRRAKSDRFRRVLFQQHQSGRRLTDITMPFATSPALKNADDRRKLADSMRRFIHKYSPHEARRTPCYSRPFAGSSSAHQFHSSGEDFEEKETSFSATTD